MRPLATANVRVSLVLGVGVTLLAITLATPAAATPVAGCTNITAPGSYTLTADVIDHDGSPCFTITASDVVLDGGGHTVDGTGNGTGIWAVGDTVNVTVRNVAVTDWESGIQYDSVDSGRLAAITARENTYGVDLQSANSHTLDDITATGNDIGARLQGSHGLVVTDSAFTGNANYGVHTISSTNHTYTNVTVNENAVGLLLSDEHTLRDSELRDNTQQAVAVTGSNNVIERDAIVDTGITGLHLYSTAGANGPNRIADNRLNNTQNTNVGGFTSDPGPNDWNVTPVAGTNVIGGDVIAGNFWAKPDGTGFSQTCTDADTDGLCDDPNQLDADNIDHHPLAVVPPNDPPSATFQYSPASPTTDDVVEFTAQATDPDGSIASYAWDFTSDGTIDATGPAPTHTFASAGDHLVTLTVTDDGGATDTARQIVSVAMGSGVGGVQDPPGVVTIRQDAPAHVQPGNTITVELYATEVDAITVAPDSVLGDADATTLNLLVDGQPVGIGTTETFSSPRTGNITLEVTTAPSLTDAFSLVIEDDAGNELTTTRQTTVHADPIKVPTDVTNVRSAVHIAVPGTTIEVGDGTYDGALPIDKNVTIKAATGASPTIADDITETNLYVIYAVDGATVTVSGITVDARGETGGLGAMTDGTMVIRDATVRGTSLRPGVSADGGTIVGENVTVEEAGSVGAQVRGAATLDLDGLTVNDTGNAGIVVHPDSVGTLTAVTLTNVEGIGLRVADGATVTLSDSRIDRPAGDGVAIEAGGNATLTNATIVRPTGHGVAVEPGGNATIRTSRVFRPDEDGIAVDGGIITVRDSTVRPFGVGVSLTNGSNATVEGTTISGTATIGVHVTRGSHVNLDRSVFALNGERGVRFDASSGRIANTTFRDVVVDDTPDLRRGVYARNGSTVTVANVVVTDGTGIGVYATGRSTVTVTGSSLHSDGDAVAFHAGAGGTVADTTIDATEGVFADDGDTVTVRNTTITAPASPGVTLHGTDGLVTDTAIAGVTRGVYAIDGTVTVRNTTVTNASHFGFRFVNGSFTVEDSSFEGGIHGVALVELADLTVVDTTILAPGNTGLDLGLRTTASITRTDVHAGTGIEVDPAADVALISVTMNDLSNTTVAILNENATASVDATGNWFGPRGPENTTFVGNVAYQPFLTVPPDELASEETQAFGFALKLPAGQVYAFGTPAPLATDLATAFDDFEGAIYVFDATTQSWSLATGDERLGAMDAVAVVPTTDARVVIDFADATPPRPTERQLAAGWNLVAPRAYDDLDGAFSTATVGLSDVSQTMAEPLGQPAAPGDAFGHYTLPGSSPGDGPRVSPFTGYFVYVTEPGGIPGTVPVGETADDVRVHLGIDETELQAG